MSMPESVIHSISHGAPQPTSMAAPDSQMTCSSSPGLIPNTTIMLL